MSFLSSFFKKKNDEVPEKVLENHATTEDEDEIAAVIASVLATMDEEEETVAAITAAIAMMLGTSANDFIVRNIKRTPEMDPIWAVAGRMKLMR